MKIIAIAVLAALSFSAQATVFGNTDSHDTYNQPQSHATGNGYGGQGGSATAQSGSVAGAAAGAAVVGSGNSTATGGKVSDSGNSSVRNEVSNAQQQGQAQGQQQSSSNSNRNSATTGASTSGATGGSASSGGNSMQGGNVTVEGDSYEAARRSVATAYAAPLTSSNGTCMGSSSGGVQGASFGVSIGSTWTDDGCNRRYNAQTLRELGQTRAALALMCQDASVAQAMQDAGGSCNNTTVRAAAPAASEPQRASQIQYQDPIVRARLGLPPL